MPAGGREVTTPREEAILARMDADAEADRRAEALVDGEEYYQLYGDDPTGERCGEVPKVTKYRSFAEDKRRHGGKQVSGGHHRAVPKVKQQGDLFGTDAQSSL